MESEVVDQFITSVVKKPEVFFMPSEKVSGDITSFIKCIFDYGKKTETFTKLGELEELYVDGFDSPQIWEQIKLQNIPLNRYGEKQIESLLKSNRVEIFNESKEADDATSGEENDPLDEEEEEEEEDLQLDEENEEDGDDDLQLDEDDEDDGDDDFQLDEDDEDELNESIESDSNKTDTSQKSIKKSRVSKQVGEDGFFNWDEMEKAAEEDEDSNSEDEEEDEEDDGEDEDSMKYEDFFSSKDNEEDMGNDSEEEINDAVNQATNDDEDESEQERGLISTHQRKMKLLKKEIRDLEKEAISEKPWMLKGEVKGDKRPENSLLEAVLDYERATRVAPTITVETTQSLEEVIKTRILEGHFDDVVRKLEANDEAKKEADDISQVKSKIGLGEIYEKEYMKTVHGFEETDENKKEQDVLQGMFDKLSAKLNALSSFHYTPLPYVKEMEVKAAVPAIAMEEVIPMGISNDNLCAPEEVYTKKHGREGVLQSEQELTTIERKRKRSANKTAKRKEKRQKEAAEKIVARINPGMGNKYEKKKLLETLQQRNVKTAKVDEESSKSFSKSSQFFSKLQDDAQKAISSVTNNSQDKATSKGSKTASSYKL